MRITAWIWLGLVPGFVAGCGDNLKVEPTPSPTPSAAPYTPRREIVSGAARLEGGRFTMDAAIGHPVSQQPIEGGGKRLESAAAIKR